MVPASGEDPLTEECSARSKVLSPTVDLRCELATEP